MTTGLYLGKFAPLHKGHQHCIETALDEVDELVVLIYDEPEVTDIPLVTRAEWIRDLYPEVTLLEAWTAPTELGYTDHIKAKHEYYVEQKLDNRGINNIDIFFSSESYGEHMAQGLDAEDYRVDEPREMYPTSGTQVRGYLDKGSFLSAYKWLDGRVFRDLVTNVVLLGGPSTGKSTLAKALAQHYDTSMMPEFGRQFWQEHADENGMLTEEELHWLAEGHLDEEEALLRQAGGEYLFTDTNAITTGLFSRWYHGSIDERLSDLMLRNVQRYDVFILCGDEIPFEPEPGRGGPRGRERLQRMHRSWLNAHGVPFYEVTGSVDERVEQVEEILADFNKWDHSI